MVSCYVLGVDPGKVNSSICLLDPNGAILANQDIPMNGPGFQELGITLSEKVPSEALLVAGVEATGSLDDNLLQWLDGLSRERRMILLRLDSAQVAGFRGPKPVRGKTDRADGRQAARFTRMYAGELQAFQNDPKAQALLRRVNERMGVTVRLAAAKNRLKDLLVISFPEFTELFEDPSKDLARAVLKQAPTAKRAAAGRVQTLARIRGTGPRGRSLGPERAEQLIAVARQSIASAQEDTDADAVRFAVRELELLLDRQKALNEQLERDGQNLVQAIPVPPVRPAAATTDPPAAEEFGPPAPPLSLAEQIRLADSLPGIGTVGACTLVMRCGGLTRYPKANALSAQLGACPDRDETGISRKTAHLTYRGDRAARSMLYMLTLGALKKNKALRFHRWRRIQNGLTKQQAVCACMNRLVHWLHGVIRSRQPFDPQKALQQAQRQHPKQWAEFLRLHPEPTDPACSPSDSNGRETHDRIERLARKRSVPAVPSVRRSRRDPAQTPPKL